MTLIWTSLSAKRQDMSASLRPGPCVRLYSNKAALEQTRGTNPLVLIQLTVASPQCLPKHASHVPLLP